MSESSIKNAVERNIALWFLGTLFTGVVAGFGIRKGMEEYTGYVLLMKKDVAADTSARESCQHALSLQKTGNATLTAELDVLSTKVASLSALKTELSQCEGELSRHNARPRQDSPDVTVMRSQIDALKLKLKNAVTVSDRLEKENNELKQANYILDKKNFAFTNPSPSSLRVLQTGIDVRPNQLLTFFDGALAFVADDIYTSAICIRLATQAQCTSLKVGNLFPVSVGDKTYGMRLDSGNTPTSWPQVSILLLKSGL